VNHVGLSFWAFDRLPLSTVTSQASK